jgi:hypothetical protein
MYCTKKLIFDHNLVPSLFSLMLGARQKDPGYEDEDRFLKKGMNFPCVIQNDWKTANFAGLYYPHFTTFRNETSENY